MEQGLEEVRDERRQQIDDERQVPVGFRQITGHGGGNNQRYVGERGAVAELLHPILPREVARNQPGGQWDYQSGTDAEQGAEGNGAPSGIDFHILGRF